MYHLCEMRGRAARRFLGEITTPGRPGESLLQFLAGINQCPRIIDGLSRIRTAVGILLLQKNTLLSPSIMRGH